MNINPLRSLNARLLLAILTSMVVALAIGGAIIQQIVKQRLLEDFDKSLRTELTYHKLLSVQTDDVIHITYLGDRE